MIDARSLARALVRRGASAWTIVERDQHIATVDAELTRIEQRTRWELIVHVDMPAGRGTAHVRLDATAGSADAIAEQAVSLAHAGMGPQWSSPPPAAPARVDLEDGSLRDPIAAAKRALPHQTGVFATVTAMRELVSVTTHAGFQTSWPATLVRLEALVAHADRSLAIARASRTLDGLGADAAISDAQHDLERLAAAHAPVAGPCSVVLHTDAMLHGGLGVWEAFLPQADAATERQGLARYREHAPIVEGADTVSEPLTIESDGALAYGLASAPLGDEGGAVRRFPLVQRGIAAGLALSPREAALRGREPNGGVRNLIVAPGTWNGTATDSRVIEIRRLRSLAIDRYTGNASLEIALGLDRDEPFTGGSLRIDLIAALATARRTADSLTRGDYVGPTTIWIDHSDLLA